MSFDFVTIGEFERVRDGLTRALFALVPPPPPPPLEPFECDESFGEGDRECRERFLPLVGDERRERLFLVLFGESVSDIAAGGRPT